MLAGSQIGSPIRAPNWAHNLGPQRKIGPMGPWALQGYPPHARPGSIRGLYPDWALCWAELSDIFLVWAPMDFLKGAQVGPMGPSWAHGDRIRWGQLGLINYGPFVVCPFGDLPSPLLPHNGALSLLAGAHGHPLCDRGRHGHRGCRPSADLLPNLC